MRREVTTGHTKQRSYNGDYRLCGQAAEEVFKILVERNPYNESVADFRNFRIIHEADIDYAVNKKDGRVLLVEVKYDKHIGRKQNVLFEVLRINHKAPPDKSCILGWSAKSPANYFAIYAPREKRFFICETWKYRRAFQDYTNSLRTEADVRGNKQHPFSRWRWIPTNCVKSTINVLIPWNIFESIFQVIDVPENVIQEVIDQFPDLRGFLEMSDIEDQEEDNGQLCFSALGR